MLSLPPSLWESSPKTPIKAIGTNMVKNMAALLRKYILQEATVRLSSEVKVRFISVPQLLAGEVDEDIFKRSRLDFLPRLKPAAEQVLDEFFGRTFRDDEAL